MSRYYVAAYAGEGGLVGFARVSGDPYVAWVLDELQYVRSRRITVNSDAHAYTDCDAFSDTDGHAGASNTDASDDDHAGTAHDYTHTSSDGDADAVASSGHANTDVHSFASTHYPSGLRASACLRGAATFG